MEVDAPVPTVELKYGTLTQKIYCDCTETPLKILGFVDKNLALSFESMTPVSCDSGFLPSLADVMIKHSVDAFIYAGKDMLLRASKLESGKMIVFLCKLRKPLFTDVKKQVPTLQYPNFSVSLYDKAYV